MSSLVTDSLFGVKGYVAVVTGGSSGLGFMIAKGLVANGAKVYLVSLPDDPIDERVSELNELGEEVGGSAYGIPSDVSDKQAIQDLASQIGHREKHVDMLISNAGIRRDPPVQ